VERFVQVQPTPTPVRKEQSPGKTETPSVQVAQRQSAADFEARTPRQELEDQVLRWGLDALPDPTPSAPNQPPLTLNSLLGAPVTSTEKPSFLQFGSWFLGGRS